ncbi:MAG: hypothetical protein IPO25_18895 [Saprospiraceae bacterium]|nr:hypothetical protein [Saprospiraceae bacterium]
MSNFSHPASFPFPSCQLVSRIRVYLLTDMKTRVTKPILLDAQLRKDRIQFFLASKAPPDSILDLIFEV